MPPDSFGRKNDDPSGQDRTAEHYPRRVNARSIDWRSLPARYRLAEGEAVVIEAVLSLTYNGRRSGTRSQRINGRQRTVFVA